MMAPADIERVFFNLLRIVVKLVEFPVKFNWIQIQIRQSASSKIQ